MAGGELSVDFNGYSLRREDADPRYDLGEEQTHIMARARWQRQMISGAGLLFTPFSELRADSYFSSGTPSSSGGGDAEVELRPSAGFDLRMPFIADHGIAQGVLTPVAQVIAAPPGPRR